MKTREKHVREPLFHITRRADIAAPTSWLIRLIAIFAALVVCALVIVLITDYNPLQVYVKMFEGAFGSQRKVMMLLQNIAMLLCISLAVTPAFKMRFWNLGAEGQVLVGGLASAACMFYAGDRMPNALLILVMLITLMMNYVAMQLVAFCIMVWVPSGSSVMGIINQRSENGWIPNLFGQKYLINILVVVLLTVVMFVYLKSSKQGYEISVVGESENTARYIGINVKKVILRTMVISGGICGLAGFLLVSGTNHTISKELAGGMGFTAIMVSWLAKFNPLMMVLTSFLIVFLQRGAGEIATAFRLNESVSDILTGIIIFFIIGCEFFINYQIHLRARKKEVVA